MTALQGDAKALHGGATASHGNRPALHVAALRQRLRELGAQRVHEERVLRQWSRAESQANGRRRPEDFLPQSLRAALPALEAELDARPHLA